jgi:predicted dehydrogenase
MASCPFPVIPQYLSEQDWPSAAVPGAQVTHVWTQDPAISAHIAAAARIPHVCTHMEDMIGQVDAVLLARDDPEHHYQMARPFIEAGLPIYIDKPAAADRATLDALFALEKWPGQIFSCSAVGYAREFSLTPEQRQEIGPLRWVEASIMKSWVKYGVHIIDPVLRLEPGLWQGAHGALTSVTNTGTHEPDGQRINLVTASWDSGFRAVFRVTGEVPAPLRITVYGERGFIELNFKDTFNAFKSALADFVEGIRSRTVRSERAFLQTLVDIIEKGNSHEA